MSMKPEQLNFAPADSGVMFVKRVDFLELDVLRIVGDKIKYPITIKINVKYDILITISGSTSK